jgi:aerobic carbon-monoxide dehydrogenase medium subunit
MSQSAYAAPKKLDEVLALLANQPGSRLLAGGQNLLVEPSRSHLAGSLLIDLRKVGELSGITASKTGVRIGAMTTIGAIATSDLVRKACPVLADAADLVGDAQVRNRATIGGAIAEADPASDLIPLLLVVNAAFEIAGPQSRTVSADDFFKGPEGKVLSATEVITAVKIPGPERSTGAAYEKMKDPATLYALCGVAAAVTLSAKGVVTQCRVAVTGATEHPVRLLEFEQALTGSEPGESSLTSAASHTDGRLPYRGNHYASSEYRAQLTQVLTERVLRRALARTAA